MGNPDFGLDFSFLKSSLINERIAFTGGCIGGASLNCINFVVAMNIATTKLIQCGITEMPENKAFHGFCGCDFLLFRSVATMHGLFCPAKLHLFLTIASNR